jgi:hypothetical protein
LRNNNRKKSYEDGELIFIGVFFLLSFLCFRLCNLFVFNEKCEHFGDWLAIGAPNGNKLLKTGIF